MLVGYKYFHIKYTGDTDVERKENDLYTRE